MTTRPQRSPPGGGARESWSQRSARPPWSRAAARWLGELDREQHAKLAELRAVVARRPDADEQAVDLLELLPLLTPERLAAAPESLLRSLFERFQLQVRYHKPQRRATVRVALSDDSLDGLLASVQDLEGGPARQDLAVSPAGAVSLAGGAPGGLHQQGNRRVEGLGRRLVIEASFQVTAVG
jgi:hypothetical protein